MMCFCQDTSCIFVSNTPFLHCIFSIYLFQLLMICLLLRHVLHFCLQDTICTLYCFNFICFQYLFMMCFCQDTSCIFVCKTPFSHCIFFNLFVSIVDMFIAKTCLAFLFGRQHSYTVLFQYTCFQLLMMCLSLRHILHFCFNLSVFICSFC